MHVQSQADNARSRMKTGLEAKEGDEELIQYYYIVMHPFTMTGFEYRRNEGAQFWKESVPKLKARFGEDRCPGLNKPLNAKE